MQTELELSNTYNELSDVFSNANGGGYVSDEEIKASAALTQQLAQNRARQKELEAQTGCRKPFFNVGKKKKAYEKCLADNKKAADEAKAKANTPTPTYIPTPVPEKNFFAKPEGIAVAVLGIGIVFFAAYKIATKSLTKN